MTPTFRRILVPTDFSATADAALDYARTLAGRFGASLHLLHVLDDPSTPGGLVAEMYTPEPPDLRPRLIKEAQSRIQTRIPKRPGSYETAGEVVFGSGARTITDYAESGGFDLIVMGTHGRTGLSHFVMGSVAEVVVRTAPCPVLTVRHGAAPATIAAAVREASSAPA
jgi:nucleotide-binding universal stress UspA family protein